LKIKAEIGATPKVMASLLLNAIYLCKTCFFCFYSFFYPIRYLQRWSRGEK